MGKMTPTPINRQMTAAEWGAILTVATFWGGSYFFVGIAVKELPTLTIVLARYIITAPLFLLICAHQGLRMPWDRQFWPDFLILGIFNQLVPFCLIAWGQGHIPSAVASILNAVGPLATVLLAHVFTQDEKLNGRRLVGVFLGLTGVVTIVGGAALKSLGVGIVAQIACITATLSYASAILFARKSGQRGAKPMELVAGQIAIAGFLLLPVELIVDQPWTLPMPSNAALLALLALAVLSSALGHMLYFRTLAAVGATNVSLVAYLMPVTAILLGVIVLGERLEARQIAGMTIIAIGLAATDGRPLAFLRRVLTPG
jgi:drug/metabolite transporter (DMT)-like permease